MDKSKEVRTRDRSESPQKVDNSSPLRGRSASPNKETNKNDVKEATNNNRRSISPPKFNAKDFDNKKSHQDEMQKRKNAVARARGIKIDPMEWTKQELMDKINKLGKFIGSEQKSTISNKQTIITYELWIESKKLLNDDIIAIMELIRRFSEIQIVKFINCGLNDTTFQPIFNQLKLLRHLKHLDLSDNLLTRVSVDLIGKYFSKLTRKIEILNLLSNSLLFEDGEALFFYFIGLLYLNNIPINHLLVNNKSQVFNVSHLHLKLPEVGIVCCILKSIKYIVDFDASYNDIDCNGLIRLIETFEELQSLQNIDISFNPMTNEGMDMKGILRLVNFINQSKNISQLKSDGIDIPKKLLTRIQQSLSVNRSCVRANNVTDFFSGFIHNQLESKKDKSRSKINRNDIPWEPKYEIDRDFIRKNNLPLCNVDVTTDDNIIITRTANYTKKNNELEI
eukprot:gene8601-11621_t